MAASSRRVLSLLSRMKAPQLLFASIALSSSWNSISLVDSFAIRSHPCSSTSAFLLPRRQVHLPPRDRRPSALSSSDDGEVSEDDSSGHSVTGPIYDVDAGPSVKLFTKEGCTLCDKVKDVLEAVREDQPHSLYAVDITDDDKQEWYAKYKWDIPVIHVNDIYWTKHKLETEDAIAGLTEATEGNFEERKGEPDSSAYE